MCGGGVSLVMVCLLDVGASMVVLVLCAICVCVCVCGCMFRLVGGCGCSGGFAVGVMCWCWKVILHGVVRICWRGGVLLLYLGDPLCFLSYVVAVFVY